MNEQQKIILRKAKRIIARDTTAYGIAERVASGELLPEFDERARANAVRALNQNAFFVCTALGKICLGNGYVVELDRSLFAN